MLLNSIEHEFIMLINVKITTINDIFTCMGIINTKSEFESKKKETSLFFTILDFMIT